MTRKQFIFFKKFIDKAKEHVENCKINNCEECIKYKKHLINLSNVMNDDPMFQELRKENE